MKSLNRIEQLPPQQRSSMVGQAGVRDDLLSLENTVAIAWLEQNIASPVSTDWGKLLNILNVDWEQIKRWLYISKQHALAAADALEFSIISKNKLPNGCNIAEAQHELGRLVLLYKSPRLSNIQQAINDFAYPAKLPKDLQKAVKILLNESVTNIAIREKETIAKWNALFHIASDRYCLTILDWKATKSEQQTAIESLPIFKMSEIVLQSELVIEVIDVGSDEFIFIVLPRHNLEELKKLVPRTIKFKKYSAITV